MKLQDILFIIFLAFLFYKRVPRYFIIAALSCLVLSIPFFKLWIFFTAERLVWYAAALLVIGSIWLLIKK